MSLFTRKRPEPAAEPSLAELHEFARIQAHRATRVFHGVVAELEASAEQHSAVAEQAQAKADEMLVLMGTALAEAASVRKQADAIGALLNG